MRGKRAVVTGGCGYVGFSLAQALAEGGCAVVLLDLASPPGPLPPGVSHVAGSVADAGVVAAACAGAALVFHVTSYGMSGREQLAAARVRHVNVAGTECVLRACVEASVAALVYVSTYNAVFGGQAVLGGDEALPRFPPAAHVDAYSATKTLAEAAVLAADGRPWAGGGGALRTCAVRPAAIWGPGEQRHLPRVARYMAAGIYKFTFSDGHGGVVDFVHVRNLVQGLLLAAEALTPARGAVAGGAAYFLSDGAPRPNFEFFNGLAAGLGYPPPRVRLPLRLVYAAALIMEAAHWAVRRWWDFEPLLVRAEVLKSGVTHWFSIEKARRELGYRPQQHDLREAVQWLAERGYAAGGGKGKGPWPPRLLLALILVAIAFSTLLKCYRLQSWDPHGPLQWGGPVLLSRRSHFSLSLPIHIDCTSTHHRMPPRPQL